MSNANTENGCCSPRGKMQMVAGFSLVIGVLTGIQGIVFLATENVITDITCPILRQGAILQTVAAIVSIAAGVSLLVGISKRNPNFVAGWFGLTGLFIIFALSYLSLAGHFRHEYNLIGYEAMISLAVGILRTLSVTNPSGLYGLENLLEICLPQSMITLVATPIILLIEGASIVVVFIYRTRIIY